MIVNMLLAMSWAKIRDYRLKPLLKAYTLYPYLCVELFYLFLQFNILLDNYFFVQYTPYFRNLHLYALMIPLFYYKIYKPGIIGSGLIVLGTLSNKFVMAQNGGKMPVFASLSKYTGYYNESAMGVADDIHIIGTELTRYKYLSDFIDIGWSILSIGDLLIHSFTFIVIYYTIKALNKKT
ncbi:MAG: DUF5317 family protein [Eubacteriales bacterium]|nr:DUF5317 family protein [Eubacteriales bacterium]